MKRWLGKGAYVLSILRELLVFPFSPYEVRTDNTVHRAASVIVANARYYGGRFVCAPGASLEGATLQVGLFERGGRLAAIGYALALVTGRLPALASYRLIEARRIEIRGRPGEPLQRDGDAIGQVARRDRGAAGRPRADLSAEDARRQHAVRTRSRLSSAIRIRRQPPSDAARGVDPWDRSRLTA